MPAAPYYRLRIKSLKFISAVDAGAQGPIANVALIKRAPTGDDVDATCRVVKVDEKMGLVFGWALATSLDGGETPHVDLQQDAIVGDDELIKIAAEFMEASAASDVMHDDSPDGKIVFCIPLTKAVTDALGIASKVHGLAIGMRPSPETFARFVSKELNAFSIAGIGERELVAKTDVPACSSCGKYGKADDETCKDCGKAMKAATTKSVLSTADKDSLPDSAFLFVESGGTKEGGKTTPLSLRHFPYRDSAGKLDIVHLRAACSDIPKSSLPKDVRDKLQVRAEKLLGQQHMAAKRAAVSVPGQVAKGTVLTSAVDGHAHSIVLTDPADKWRCGAWSTSYQASEGSDMTHNHALTYDEATGVITVGEDSGHTHTVDAIVPIGLRAAAVSDESSDGVCAAPPVDDDDGSGPTIVIVSARAPEGISPPSTQARSVKSKDKEPTVMADHNDVIRALQTENALLKSMATLTDAQRAHHDKLISKGVKSDADAFLSLTSTQRNVVLGEIAKANTEVYTSKSTGRVYRNDDAIEIIEAARQTDAMAETMKRLDTERTELDFSKRGAVAFANFAKGVKGNLHGRFMKALAGEFTDPAEFAEAERAFKQANVALAELTKVRGYTPSEEESGANVAQKKLHVAVDEFAKAHKLSYPVALERATAPGGDDEIRRLYNDAMAEQN